MNKSHKMMTSGHVAARLGVSIDTVKRIVKTGELKANRIGKWLRFDPVEVQRYLDDSVVN